MGDLGREYHRAGGAKSPASLGWSAHVLAFGSIAFQAAVTPLDLKLNGYAKEVRPVFTRLPHRIYTGKCAVREPGGHLLIICLWSCHGPLSYWMAQGVSKGQLDISY